MPSASATRCGLVTALVNTRVPVENPLMRSNSSAGEAAEPSRDLGDAADLVAGIGAFDAAQRAERIDRQDESAKVLIHASIPPR